MLDYIYIQSAIILLISMIFEKLYSLLLKAVEQFQYWNQGVAQGVISCLCNRFYQTEIKANLEEMELTEISWRT